MNRRNDSLRELLLASAVVAEGKGGRTTCSTPKLPSMHQEARSQTWIARVGYYWSASGKRVPREHRLGPDLGDALVKILNLHRHWTGVKEAAKAIGDRKPVWRDSPTEDEVRIASVFGPNVHAHAVLDVPEDEEEASAWKRHVVDDAAAVALDSDVAAAINQQVKDEVREEVLVKAGIVKASVEEVRVAFLDHEWDRVGLPKIARGITKDSYEATRSHVAGALAVVEGNADFLDTFRGNGTQVVVNRLARRQARGDISETSYYRYVKDGLRPLLSFAEAEERFGFVKSPKVKVALNIGKPEADKPFAPTVKHLAAIFESLRGRSGVGRRGWRKAKPRLLALCHAFVNFACTQGDAATLNEQHLKVFDDRTYVVRVRKKNERRVKGKRPEETLLLTCFATWDETIDSFEATWSQGREDGLLFVTSSTSKPYPYVEHSYDDAETGEKRVLRQDPIGNEFARHVKALKDANEIPDRFTLKAFRKFSLNWTSKKYGDNGVRSRLLGGKSLDDLGDFGLRERLLRGQAAPGTLRSYAVDVFEPLTEALDCMRSELIEAKVLKPK